MRLVVEDEAGTRFVVPLAEEAVVVGRAADATVRLADRDVSRHHARFLQQGGSAWVEDLGSLTGTRVNGERIAGRRRLREGDLVAIGAYDLAVLTADALAAGAASPPPLPASPRAPGGPPTPRPAGPAPSAAAPAPRRPPVRRAVAVLAVALALGLAAAYAVGLLGAPPELTPP